MTKTAQLKPRAHMIDGEWVCYIDIKKRGGVLSVFGFGGDLEEAYCDFLYACRRHGVELKNPTEVGLSS